MKLSLVICLIALSAGCASRPQSEAELRLRRYFHITNDVALESKPCPLLSTLAVGTPEKEVFAFLDENGVGKDGMSSYYPAGERGEIVCRVEYDLKSPGLVKESFVVLLRLDEERKLREIIVLRGLTGP